VTGTSYTEAFKAQIVAKLTTSGRPVQEFAKELGLHPGLLYRWRRESARRGFMVTRPQPPKMIAQSAPQDAVEAPPRRPQDWSPDEKIAVVMESLKLEEAQLGGLLRRRGLHKATLDEWREAMLRGGKAELAGRQEKATGAEVRRVKELERELHRKDKALAEAAALLVLQKKVRALLEGVEDDT
jgi:transposase